MSKNEKDQIKLEQRETALACSSSYYVELGTEIKFYFEVKGNMINNFGLKVRKFCSHFFLNYSFVLAI